MMTGDAESINAHEGETAEIRGVTKSIKCGISQSEIRILSPQPTRCIDPALDSGSERSTLCEQRMITARRRCHEETVGIHRVRED
jgi:hypothetical protein